MTDERAGNATQPGKEIDYEENGSIFSLKAPKFNSAVSAVRRNGKWKKCIEQP
jgi:hypothetical protein